jgi:RNA polymerase sigma-70 factor (ECF subfamily)
LNDADFRPLILAELDAVFRLACHLSRDREGADDLVQETYLRALRSAHTFSLAAHGVRPWLFKILHNVTVTRGAKHQREHEILSEHRASMPDLSAETAVDRCDAAIDWENVDERLKTAVAELALPYRATFLLSAVEGLKYHEIADVTQVPVGTVMSRLSRARAALAKRLADLAVEHRIARPRTEAPKESPKDS